MTIVLPTHGQLNWDTALNTALTRLDFQSSSPDVFNVLDYGAVGDGVTNDTAAIRTAINTAVAYAVSSGRFDCTVYFPSHTYLLSSNPIKGGTTFGNSQIPIPIIATTANKVTLRLKGVGESGALPHWQQTNPEINGTVLKSTYTETMDNTNGECSVIGGPTPQHGYGLTGSALFNNVMIVIDGIQLQTKHDHTLGWISGFDFRGLAEMHVINAGSFVDIAPPTITIPDGTGFEFALAAPLPANNAFNKIDSFSCEGYTYGVWLTEHCAVTQLVIVYCYTGIAVISSFEGSGAAQHNLFVAYAAVEACHNAVLVTSGSRCYINQLDVENISGNHLADSTSNNAVGYLGLGGIISSIVVSDPTRIKVEYVDRWPGNFSAPSIPSSGTSFRNPAWRDAAIVITGGTVTAISVDGVVTGATSGTFFLPSGRNISLTYSVAPTWTWTLL